MNFFFKNPDLQNELNIYLSWFLCDWNMKQLFSSTNRCWSIFPPKQEIVVNHRSRQENRSPWFLPRNFPGNLMPLHSCPVSSELFVTRRKRNRVWVLCELLDPFLLLGPSRLEKLSLSSLVLYYPVNKIEFKLFHLHHQYDEDISFTIVGKISEV